MRRITGLLLGCAALTALAACGDKDNGRPKPKPDELATSVVQSDAGSPDKNVLTRARISTKSGDILILEPDGTVTEMKLDSPEGRDAFAVTEADLMALNANLGLDLSGIRDMGPVAARQPTAQERALEDFSRRTRPMRLNLPATFEVNPEDFKGVSVNNLSEGRRGAGKLVEVQANLRRGVDADTAFAYASCALATWAESNGTHYARHIRTLQDKKNGELIVGAVFTLSEKKPMGLTVMTTKDTLQECKTRGIPAT